MRIRQPFSFVRLCKTSVRVRPVLAVLSAAWVGLLSSGACAADRLLTLEAALQAAQSHADVAMATQEVDAARGELRAADRRPAPVLSAKAAQIDLQNGIGGGRLFSDKRIDKSLGVDWTWERGNKRALRVQAAQQNIAAARASVDDARLNQMLLAQAAFFDLLSAQERLAEVEAMARSAAELSASTERREKVGDVGRQDVARGEIEARRAQSDVAAARLERERAGWALSQAIGEDGRRDTASLVAAIEWPISQDLPDTDEATAVEARPEVRAAVARAAAARMQLDSARALGSTDITWGASVDHYPGTSNRLVELRMQMPLAGRDTYAGEAQRARAESRRAEIELDKVRAEARVDERRLRTEATIAAQRTREFEQEIVPRARQVVERAELAYRQGGLSITELLEARRTLRATLVDALAARTDHAKALGAWRVRQRPLDGTGT